MTEHRNGGAAVVETLAAQGVDTIFGIPGTHNLEIYRHLPTTGIRAVTPRHEQGAGYAAEAYARVTGRPGVVVATSGPGLTNTMTAAATAYAESQPMLILSSGMPTGTEGQDLGQLHEAKNTSAAMDQLIRWSRRVHTAEEAAAAVTDAFESFTGGRPRPVHVEIPVDVLEQHWSGGPVRRDQRRGARGATCRWRSHRGQLAGHVLRFGCISSTCLLPAGSAIRRGAPRWGTACRQASAPLSAGRAYRWR
jgi:thiamine pyrophosphate-dependent acetolactate synthase large subunit-like protein